MFTYILEAVGKRAKTTIAQSGDFHLLFELDDNARTSLKLIDADYEDNDWRGGHPLEFGNS